MNCQHCNAENINESKFCKACGSQMSFSNPAKSKATLSDTLLLIYIGFYAFTTILQFILQSTHSENRYAFGIMSIIHNISTMLLPLAIKNSTIKIIAIAISAIIMIYYVYRNASYMFRF